MTARKLSFTAPREVVVRTEAVPDPGPNEVLVETALSAISPGTEGLVYRGDAPTDLPADESIDALGEDLSFPLSYGYAAVGTVTAVGADVDEAWLERSVFAYNPHESHFLANTADLVPIPEGVSLRGATMLANVESAVTFVLDGEPILGEHVAVMGQGVVGLLTTALLAQMPLETLVTFDTHPKRQALSKDLGADRSLEPETSAVSSAFQEYAGARADLTYELSGNPDALDDAIATTGFGGRVIVGSWYGNKPVTLDLGSQFHRDRIELQSSQVSTIAPKHRGRWSRERRHELAWAWLSRLDFEDVFTHEIPIERASEAYRLLEERPDEAIQVVFTYE